MKKVLYIILTVTLFIFSISANVTKTALATSEYMRITSENAVFYSAESLSEDDALFVLPRGYYVKVINQTEQRVYCEFADSTSGYSKILGYVKTENLTLGEGIFPLYPKVQITALSVSPIFSRPDTNSKTVLTVFAGQNMSFYGYSENKDYIFVLVGTDFGFISSSAVQKPVISSHPVPLPTPVPSPKPTNTPASTTPIEGSLTSSMQILLIAFILIPMILLSIVIFKK